MIDDPDQMRFRRADLIDRLTEQERSVLDNSCAA